VSIHPFFEELSVAILSRKAGLLLDEILGGHKVRSTRIKLRTTSGHNTADIGLAGSKDVSVLHLVVHLGCCCGFSIRTSFVVPWSSLNRLDWDQSVTKVLSDGEARSWSFFNHRFLASTNGLGCRSLSARSSSGERRPKADLSLSIRALTVISTA